MIKILFVCHGNICRSPMAQIFMQNLISQNGLDDKIYVDSKATHTDEIGSPPYYETVRILRENSIPIIDHKATQITHCDLANHDLILCMDDENMHSLKRVFGTHEDIGQKVKFLLEFAPENLSRNASDHKNFIIDDPYYTRDFKKCYEDISRSCEGLLEYLMQKI
ncbi:MULTISPECIES: low molecular weight protein-tyrosine-phosphatase [unclassified Campylobacter]|uniref:low molecular weight protein-tyrosine-phosphatase n=1 Tax=Campylobacter TaxID=194 RepID=UPI001883AB1F|nr:MULTISPECIES: low molecular weight protein-tyrosine-phosphatase [unclassified Campylobacter]